MELAPTWTLGRSIRADLGALRVRVRAPLRAVDPSRAGASFRSPVKVEEREQSSGEREWPSDVLAGDLVEY